MLQKKLYKIINNVKKEPNTKRFILDWTSKTQITKYSLEKDTLTIEIKNPENQTSTKYQITKNQILINNQITKKSKLEKTNEFDPKLEEICSILHDITTNIQYEAQTQQQREELEIQINKSIRKNQDIERIFERYEKKYPTTQTKQ